MWTPRANKQTKEHRSCNGQLRKETAEEAQKAEKRVALEIGVLRERVAAARKRARDVEGKAKQSAKRLKRAQKAEALVKELRVDKLEAECLSEEDAEMMDDPKTQQGSRRDARGRFMAEPWQMRPIKWAQMARRVPTSAIAANVSDVLAAFAPDVSTPTQTCERELRKQRGELTIAGESIAAFRIALAKRIISFGFDESTKFGLGLLSTNMQIEPHDAPGTSVDIVPRGASLTAGGKATEVAASIEKNIFSHLRALLDGWKAAHEKRFGAGSWAAAGAPEPKCIGLHRLCEESLIMSDTCNAARACKRLIVEMAEAAGKKKIGDDAWEAMSESERERKCKIYVGDCHQHLRNIIINAMSIKATEYLKTELGESLADFSAFDRMSVDGMDLIRAFDQDMKEPHLIWASGRVVRVADGLSDKRSSRARKILPGGALLWAWDADPERGEAAGEQWLILLPNKWNRQVHYGWRYDPCELKGGSPAVAATTPAPTGRRTARRTYVCESDDEAAM